MANRIVAVLSAIAILLNECLASKSQPFSIQDTQHEQYRANLWKHADVDISKGSKYLGLTTFTHLPYNPTCFEDDSKDAAADIVIVGAPFDTGVSARPGARYGPLGIRSLSQRISPDFDYDEYGFNPFQSWATIIDCGDVPMLPFDNRIALAQLQKAHELILARGSKDTTVSPIPRIITLGGDHTITLPALRAIHKSHGLVTVLHFDSHIDTWSPDALGAVRMTSVYAGVNHGTWGWHAFNEKLLNTNNMHVGIRAPYSNPREDLETDKKCGFEIVNAKAIDRIGVAGVISAIKKHVGDSKVYLSVDIDVLDPAFAPGATGTPEAGGYTTRELLAILDGLDGLNIVGADVVEVAPAYDGPGEITSLAAAEVAHSILELMVKTPVRN